MDDLVKNGLLVTFLLYTLWKSSESYNLAPNNVLHNNRSLERFRRQETQMCNGDFSKIKCSTTHDCIYPELLCNGIQDCTDGSDEDESLCKNISKKCHSPYFLLFNGQWIYHKNGKKGTFSNEIPSSTVIIYSCDDGYKLSVTEEPTFPVVCLPTGDWSPRVEPITCQKLCPSLHNSPKITLTCMNDGFQVHCDKATDNTVLTYKCAPYYEPRNGQKKSNTCYDGSWDYIPECIPVCGKKRVSATPLIVHGRAVKRGIYPWSVAIYSSMNSDPLIPILKTICGGSLITTNIVLSAAHCVANERGVVFDAKYFFVGAGKYFNSYEDTRDDNTAQYAEVVDIAIPSKFKEDLQSFEGDIALLKLKRHFALSKVVQPVCFNNLPPLEVNSIGVVTGWDYTTGKPSDVLTELEMPYDDKETCLNYLDPDFTLKYFTDDKMCAGFNDRNASVCQEYSGSGLAFRSSSQPKRYFVYGIVSIGHSFFKNNKIHCNDHVLLTKVEDYITWIRLKVREWNPNEINY